MSSVRQPPPVALTRPDGAPTSDNPQAYIAGDRRRALARGASLPDRVRGAALFADISGFTPLTEAMVAELGPQRGAEALTSTLGVVFDAVLVELHRYGGSVIYFSGDAVTCWLDGDDGVLATECGLAMQRAMATVSQVSLPSGRAVTLSMKVAISVGPARRFVVGDPTLQLIDVLAGTLMDDLAGAEGAARTGEVVLDRSALDSLGDRVEVSERRTSPSSGRTVAVVGSLGVVAELPEILGEEPVLAEDVVRPWLLPAVYERLRTGRGEFLAELRNAVPLFLRFGGIDYDNDPRAQQKLNAFVTEAQRVISGYGGNALQLTLGDKGAYLYAVFGSPIAHEDDAARACAAALELRGLDRGAVTGISIGVASGRLRSGTYGHATRRTFCCLGDAVNLAARLMSAAPAGEIYVSDQVKRAAGDRYRWDRDLLLQVKGKAAAIEAHVLGAGRPGRGHRQHTLPIVGREPELALLDRSVTDTLDGRGQVVGICAEAGVGKSRLLAEVAAGMRQRGMATYHGEAQAFGANTAYSAWQDIWAGIFEVPVGASVTATTARLHDVFSAVAPELAARIPLLGAVLGMPLPDTELTAGLDPKLRKESLEALLGQFLALRASADRPVALLLEDCQWLDPLSRDLLEVLSRSVSRLPVQIVAAYRPPDRDAEPPLALDRENVREIRLGELAPAAAAAMTVSRLATLSDRPGGPPAALTDLVLERAQGNPFYIEELLTFILSRGIDPDDEDALRRLELPDGLHNLVLSRIDTLAEAPRRTAKVASVVGRAFRVPLLRGAYPELGTTDQVTACLRALQGLDLVLAEEAELAYLFRHIVTRDVAYESMPFAIREMLHEQVGAHLERASADPSLDLLAHHYWYSANADKKIDYLQRAGEAAQAAYANAAAADYYHRLVPLLEDSVRGPVLLRLGQVLELTGSWAGAEAAYAEGLTLAKQAGDRLAGAWAHAALAEVSRKQGRFEQAAEALELAFQDFVAVDDQAGVGRVLHLGGTLAAQRGGYDEARDKYTASLEIRRQLGDKPSMASLLSNLGVVAEYDADYAGARDLNEQALALRIETGDRWAIGVSQNNLGMISLLEADYQGARDRFTESMRLNREVGDLWMVAISHNNLGNALRGLGQFGAARRHYAESLQAYRLYDDRWALAILFEDIATLAAVSGRAEPALLLAGAADKMRDSLGAPRSPSQQEQLHLALAPARAALPDDAEGLVERGRRMTVEDAVAAVETVCSSADSEDEEGSGAA